MADISVQLSEQKRLVDFKTYDFSVKELVSMINDGIINYYCPLNMIIFYQLLENEELREFLFWTSPLYEFNVSSGGGSAASISISLRSSSGLLKNVCILR